jgi:hypothetical protein
MDKVEEYKQLKSADKLIKQRLIRLKADLMSQLVDGRVGNLKLQERNLTTFNEDRVWELMDRYGIPHAEFTYKVPYPPAIEQLYLDGRLTDADLRYIREPKYSYVLVEEEVEDV